MKSEGAFEPLRWSGTMKPTLPLVAIPMLPQGKQHPELLKFEHHPTVGSKVRALLSRYSGLARLDVRFT
jgi:hypothetical protein